jgi:hypothetical protein
MKTSRSTEVVHIRSVRIFKTLYIVCNMTGRCVVQFQVDEDDGVDLVVFLAGGFYRGLKQVV